MFFLYLTPLTHTNLSNTLNNYPHKLIKTIHPFVFKKNVTFYLQLFLLLLHS
ncbi:protein of unknown function [Tenacibaculum sp. 190524A02b]|uniref:Uncharacterized protein n=1 Tax=Tenacibaculum vairaonense TaxID=3137860 RepID=A0ABP1F904_9FLAO